MEKTEHVGYVTCEVEVVLACTDMRGGGRILATCALSRHSLLSNKNSQNVWNYWKNQQVKDVYY